MLPRRMNRTAERHRFDLAFWRNPARRPRDWGIPSARDAIPSGLRFVPFSFTLGKTRVNVMDAEVMDAEKEREIIRLWNQLRLLEQQGRPVAAVRRQIEKALAERERHAA